MRKHILIIAAVLLLFCCFTRCKKDDVSLSKDSLLNIVLYNQPLETIQKYIQGKWKLQYTYGGLSTHKYIEAHNSYMILSPEHITIGNDSAGVIVDTSISWVKTDVGSNDFTYLLSYSWSGYLWPENEIINQIKNDTLIIRDYVSDGYSYYYTRY